MRVSAIPSLRKTVSIVRSALNSLADADSDAADADSHVLRCSKFAETCDKQNKERRVCAKVCGGWSTTCGDQCMHLLSSDMHHGNVMLASFGYAPGYAPTNFEEYN